MRVVVIVAIALAAPVAAADTRWAVDRIVPTGDIDPDLAISGSTICLSDRTVIRLRCVDADTGRVRFDVPDSRGDKPGTWTSRGLAIEGAEVVQAYSAGVRVIVRRIGLVDGAIHTPASATMRNPVADVVVRGATAIVSSGSGVAAIELSSGAILKETVVDGVNGHLVEREGIVFVTAAGPSVHAFDLRGTERWTYRGKPKRYLRPLGFTPGRVMFSDDMGAFVALDLATGKQLATRQLGGEASGGYLPPTSDGTTTYALSDKLYALDGSYAPQRSVKLDRWITSELVIVGDDLVLHGSSTLFVLDRKTLAITARFPIAGWEYTGVRSLPGDRIVVVDRFRYNYDYDTELKIMRRTRGAQLEIAPGIGVFEDGVPIATGMLAEGPHSFDVLRAGFRPVRVDVTLTVGATVRLDPASLKLVPAPVERAGGDQMRLPAGVEIAKLIDATPRRIPHPQVLRDAGSLVQAAGVIYGIGKTGLVAWDPQRAKVLWQRPLDQLGDKRVSTPEYHVAAVSPADGVIVIVTQGYLTNRFGAFELATGALRWSVPIKVSLPFGESQIGAMYIPAFHARAGLLWGKTYHSLYALDLTTGRRIVQVQMEQSRETFTQLLFAGDRVYYFAGNDSKGYLSALDLPAARIAWTKEVAPRQDMVMSSDGTRVLLLGRGTITAIDAAGVQRAQRSLAGKVGDMAPVLAGNTIYLCGNFASQLYALEASTLALRWTHRRTGAHTDPCPKYGGDGQLLATADSAYQMVLDERTGKVIAEKPQGDDAVAAANDFWTAGSELCFLHYNMTTCYRP